MEITLSDLADDPSFFLYEIDFQEQHALFYKIEPEWPNIHCRNALLRKPILVPLKVLLRQTSVIAAPLPAPINFIWMTDFCGSTLYARALNEVPGIYLYNETHLFRDIANARRFAGRGLPPMSNEQWRDILKIALFYQRKTFVEGDVALVKEFPASNYILHEILDMEKTFRGIFMYANLDEYLVSCLKVPSRRKLARTRVTRIFFEMRTIDALKGIDPVGLSDAQVAALHWLYLMYWHQSQGYQHHPGLRTLHNKDFFANPDSALQRSARHFNKTLGREEAQKITQGHVFNSHSKDTSKYFSMDLHESSLSFARRQFEQEITSGLEWAETITRQHPLPEILETSLLK